MTETPTDDEEATEDETAGAERERLVMEEVRHEPPNAGTSRTYERGHEGRDEDAAGDGEEASDDE